MNTSAELSTNAQSCPPWCVEHILDGDNPGEVAVHMASDCRFDQVDDRQAGVHVRLEWSPSDFDAPVINVANANEAYLTAEQAEAMGAELIRVSALARGGVR